MKLAGWIDLPLARTGWRNLSEGRSAALMIVYALSYDGSRAFSTIGLAFPEIESFRWRREDLIRHADSVGGGIGRHRRRGSFPHVRLLLRSVFHCRRALISLFVPCENVMLPCAKLLRTRRTRSPSEARSLSVAHFFVMAGLPRFVASASAIYSALPSYLFGSSISWPTCRLGSIRSCNTRTISTRPGSTAR